PSPEHQDSRFIRTATGPSMRGQVAAISRFVDERGGYIEEFGQYDDPATRHFFSRAVFRTGHAPDAVAQLAERCEMATADVGLTTRLQSEYDRPRVLIMVSRLDHCLRDLLYRRARGELAMEVTAIVSNHRNLASIAAQHGLRFVHLPVSNANRVEQEAQLATLIEETQSELIVLARYMQILSDKMAQGLQGHPSNIHHSFLPGYKGARPYRQAYDRGVKLIGATAHFVTADLDEGPIIEQEVARVDHTAISSDLVERGRDCECQALSRAVRFYLQRRVFLNGQRTVVL